MKNVLLGLTILCLCGGLRAAEIGEPPSAPEKIFMERMAAFHETIIRMSEVVPDPLVLTYHTGIVEAFLVGRLSTYVETNDGLISPDQAQNLVVEDFPGGIEANYQLDDIELNVRQVPLVLGRDTQGKDGAVVYSVRSSPAAPIRIRCRGGQHLPSTHEFFKGYQNIAGQFVNPANAITIHDGYVLFKDPELPFYTAISTAGGQVNKGESSEDAYVDVRYPGGTAKVIIAFGEDEERAAELVNLNAEKELKRVSAYYEDLLQARIETPEPLLDLAFRSAIYNMEYNYQKPYGWVECIHHWMPIWHQQHTRAAEWLGQEDRSRLTIESQAVRIKPENQIPNLLNDGEGIVTFGGTNQFWSWELRHYLKSTDDVAFANEMIPYMDRVLEGTLDRDDPDGNGLYAWGLQIGNQEDFIATPHDGTVPTIEAINMMKTRAELAETLGNDKTAAFWRARAAKSHALLKDKLWIRDLGRFAFFEDATGMQRLDGAYQAFLYPAIWDIVDPLDQYTGVRHTLDRLMGPDGEVYCSNNFPEHYTGTWGMQAGCAQQPWGAWGLAKMGLRNEAYRPLKAAAQWVMDINKRGSWPEVAGEPCPAYFSPPASLYISAMVEAIFGLKPDVPKGILEVSPAFADDWPQARLHLPEYQAQYRRKGNTLRYAVTSQEKLKRTIRWKLPVCEVMSLKVNGRKTNFELAAGVDCVELVAQTDGQKETHIEIQYRPVSYHIKHVASMAEGDSLEVLIEGASIEKVVDRCGVLADWQIEGSGIRGTVASGLLQPYLEYGRLGQLNFSRRTFFLECISKGVRFFKPVDLLILPRYEVSNAKDVHVGKKGTSFDLMVRNNTQQVYDGKCILHVAGDVLPLDLKLGARSEKKIRVNLPRSFARHLSMGDNTVALVFEGPQRVETIITVAEAVNDGVQWKPVTLDETKMLADTDWPTLRNMQGAPHIFFVWPKWQQPLEALENKKELSVPEIPGLSFAIHGRKFVPVSRRIDQPFLKLALEDGLYRKFYLLVLPLVDNHDMFSPVGRVIGYRGEAPVLTRTLHFPGDMDFLDPHQEGIGGSVRGRETRYGLLPLRTAEQGDWSEGQPPSFPQAEFWSRSVHVQLESGTLTVLEVDLAEPVKADALVFECVGEYAAFGILGIVAETVEDRNLRRVFDFTQGDDLTDWTIEGNAFSVAAVPSLFQEPTLNSLAKGGERATGGAISPAIEIKEGDLEMILEYQGGRTTEVDGRADLVIRLLDAASGEVLEEIEAPGTHVSTEKNIDVHSLADRIVQIELVDRSAQESYAWIGLKSVKIKAAENR